MQTRFPKITVEEDRIFIVDGPVWTSAGATAALDLALAMVEKDLGADVARSTARLLVMHQRRAGGQCQHSELLALSPKSDRIQNAIGYAEKHLRSELSVGKLAEVANLSPRQFSRAFQKETGQSPAKAVEKLTDSHIKQVLNYLAASKLRLGLLVNFGGDSLEWKRVVL